LKQSKDNFYNAFDDLAFDHIFINKQLNSLKEKALYNYDGGFLYNLAQVAVDVNMDDHDGRLVELVNDENNYVIQPKGLSLSNSDIFEDVS